MGGVLIEFLLKDFIYDLEVFYNNINERIKVIWICNLNNLIGIIVKRKELYDFIKLVFLYIVVVVDQVYKEYIDDLEYLDVIEWFNEFENFIVFQIFLKIYGFVVLRVGYVIVLEEIIEKLNRVRLFFNVNYLVQIVVIFVFDDEEYVNKVKELNKKFFEFFYKSFEEMGFFYIKLYGNFVMVDVKKDVVEVFKKFFLKGIIVRLGDIFGMLIYLRVIIGQEGDNMGFIKVLKEILQKKKI